MRKTARLFGLVALGLVACEAPKTGNPTAPSTASASADAGAGASASAGAGADSSASAAPLASATPSATPSASAVAVPNVDVKNIGMHIGGGPNDAATKEPIAKSVEPHFDELRRCFATVADPKRGGDFGVDLLIEPEGGKAKVSHPRTAIKGEGFEACVVKVFEAIDFLKPRTGKTMVSYSLRFAP